MVKPRCLYDMSNAASGNNRFAAKLERKGQGDQVQYYDFFGAIHELSALQLCFSSHEQSLEWENQSLSNLRMSTTYWSHTWTCDAHSLPQAQICEAKSTAWAKLAMLHLWSKYAKCDSSCSCICLLYHFLCCFSQLSILKMWQSGKVALPFLIEGTDWRGKRVVIAGMGAFAVENVQGTQGSNTTTLKRHWVLIPTGKSIAGGEE